MTDVFVARAEEFDGDARLAVEHGPMQILVFRHAGRFYAFENRCAHSGGPVAEGTVLGRVEAVLGPDMTCLGERFSTDELHLVCPWHGWEYDLETGEYAGDRSVRINRFDVVERDGAVYVRA